MNWAELRDLVVALPEDSATKAALAGDIDGRRWNSGTYLQAGIYNVLLMAVRILWAAGQLKGRPPEMDPIEAPRLERLEADDEAQAVAQQRAEVYLDSFSPGRREQDEADVELWQARLRELETAQ
ncbi:hypothetical protein ACIHCX_03490 [Streptomyces sp. NPDC052043]|uniref:hypothetical protein n=1 Tax=Streptomyces sp. NPDC052043 TaxID=3365684 RepID=UPI0037CF8BE3